MIVVRWLLSATLIVGLAGCGLNQTTPNRSSSYDPAITMPMFPGWFDGDIVYYITTDAWPRQVAIDMGANYTPRLRHSLPPRPKPPELDTVVERIYVFPGKEQPSILPSSPEPLGADSRNEPYSPIWVLYEVTWLEPAQQRELTSEGALFDAQSRGWVEITPTDKVVNCAIVADAEGNSLRNTRVHGLR